MPRKGVVTFGEIMLRLSTPRFELIGQNSSYEAVYGGGRRAARLRPGAQPASGFGRNRGSLPARGLRPAPAVPGDARHGEVSHPRMRSRRTSHSGLLGGRFGLGLGWRVANARNLAGEASGNVLFYPADNLMFGAELMWGQRENNDGASEDNVRFQFTAKYNFGFKF